MVLRDGTLRGQLGLDEVEKGAPHGEISVLPEDSPEISPSIFTMWGYSGWSSTSQGKSPHLSWTKPAPWLWSSSLQNHEKIHFYEASTSTILCYDSQSWLILLGLQLLNKKQKEQRKTWTTNKQNKTKQKDSTKTWVSSHMARVAWRPPSFHGKLQFPTVLSGFYCFLLLPWPRYAKGGHWAFFSCFQIILYYWEHTSLKTNHCFYCINETMK